MLLKSIIKPSLGNISIWLNTCFLLALLLLGWADSFAIIMIYFFETLIIGVLQIFKMGIAGAYQNRQKMESQNPIGMILFFIVHYSFFVGIQSIFVFSIFSEIDPNIKDGFDIFDNFFYAWSYPGIKISLLLIFCSLLFQMYVSFIRTHKHHQYSVIQLMIQPYLRIFIQQFVVIISGFFTIFFPNGIFIALVLILFRFFIDLSAIYIGKNIEQKRSIAKFLSQKMPEKEN
jgi:hypothetical protein